MSTRASEIIGHNGVFVLGVGTPEHDAEIVQRLERHFADMARKAFVNMRFLDRRRIRAVLAERAEREAERFLGFGHGAGEAEQHRLQGEDLALHLDFEVLKGLVGLHDLRLSDLEGVSPEDWYVRRFTRAWVADFVAPSPSRASEDAA